MLVTVLIVDDSKLARIVAGKAVAELQPDWQKAEASSAEEAMGVIETADPEVALIDYNMAGKNGLDLASDLRVVRPDMPIALITANIQDEIIARAREIGVTFVAKPVTAQGLEGFISGAALRLRSQRA